MNRRRRSPFNGFRTLRRRGVLGSVATLRQQIEGTQPGGMTATGRQTVTPLKIFGVDTLPSGVSLVGKDVTVSGAGAGLDNWDITDKKVILTGTDNFVTNCFYGPVAVVPDGQWPIQISFLAVRPVVRFNTIDGFNGYGGPNVFIDCLASGTGVGTLGPVDCLIERNRFLRPNGDVLKAAGSGINQWNYFGPITNYPAGTVAWAAGTTYALGAFALVGVGVNGQSILMRSRTAGNIGNQPPGEIARAYSATLNYEIGNAVTFNGNTFISLVNDHVGNTPPATPTSNGFWQYSPWESLDPHCDAITQFSAIGTGWVHRWNYFQWDQARAQGVGATQIIRFVRNNATGHLMGPGEFSQNVADGPFAGFFAVALGFAGAWTAGTTYPANSYASVGAQVYRSLVGSNVGNPPASSPSQWVAVSDVAAPGPFKINNNWLPRGASDFYWTAGTINGLVDEFTGNTDVQTAAAVTLPTLRTAPVNASLPSLSGTMTENQTLTISLGTFTGNPAPTITASALRRNGTLIASPAPATYQLLAGDVGATLTVEATATNSRGSVQATSPATATIAPAPTGFAPVNSVLPAITGTATEGQTLTRSTGTWSGAPGSFVTRWYRNGVAIPGATGAIYVPVLADVGAQITVEVDAINAFGTGNAVSAGVGPVFYAMIPYVLLDSFDALGSRTANAGVVQSIVAPVAQGTGALQAVLSGVQNPGLTNPNIGVNEAPTTWDLMAVLVDLGDVARGNTISALRPTITTNGVAYAYFNDTTVAGTAQPNLVAAGTARGKRWRSFPAKRLRQTSWAGARLTTAPAAAKSVALGAQQLANGDWNATIKVDALIRPQRHKPCIALTGDDGNIGHLTKWADVLQARGLFATGYAPMNYFGQSTRLTLADAFTLKNTYGWTWCLNSGPIDEPLIGFPTVAASIAQLNAHRDSLIASGLGDAESARHVAASYGPVTYPQKPVSRSATGNGTTIVAVSGGVWSANIAPGMLVKGTGLGTDPTVVAAQSNTAVTLSQALPSGPYTLNFCGNDMGLAVTCNGTTSVTVATAGLFVGQEMTGLNVPANTFITVLGAGVVTVSNAVPATCTRASFLHTNGEFGLNKMDDALIAAGYKSLRLVSLIGGMYTGYGIDPKAAMQFNGMNIDEVNTSAVIIANLQMAIDDCVDTITFSHSGATHPVLHMQQVADFVQARQAAGDFDVVSVPELFRRASLRSPFA